jgi:CheY-like chemotaxis protein
MTTTLNILVVDDRKTHRQYISDVLQSAGYFVEEAENTQAAQTKILGETVFQLMVLDQMMPDQTGTEFLTILREDQRYKDLPVVLITAYPEDDEVKAIDKTGLIVLPKPLRDYHDILKAVENLCPKK